MDPKYYGNHRFVATRLMHVSLVYSNPTYQAFITPKPDCHPFNSLGVGVINKRVYKTGKVPDLPHNIFLTIL